MKAIQKEYLQVVAHVVVLIQNVKQAVTYMMIEQNNELTKGSQA